MSVRGVNSNQEGWFALARLAGHMHRPAIGSSCHPLSDVASGLALNRHTH